VIGAILAAACHPRPAPALVTTAETSGFVRTGRYDEVVRLCHDFARAHADVRCDEIGRTVEDRPIVAVLIGRPHRRKVPTIMIQAGIHAGEIDGKDAGFWFLRDVLAGRVAPGVLDVVDVAFVPVMNPDGHERFGPNHRPNQRGPESMGFRTNAANLNLNRDYVKVDAPETRAVVGLFAEVDPVILIDLHTTDGAKFEHDISVNFTPVAPRGDQLDEIAAAISDRVMRRLTELGHLPVPFYPSFVDDEDPGSGFAILDPPPRFSHSYAAARNRLAALVETHSWRTYQERVRSSYHALQAIFELAIADAAAWRAAEDAAYPVEIALRGTEVPIVFDTDDRSREIEFRGYAYDRRSSEVSGGTWLVYDEATPQIWKVPLREHLVPAITVTAPAEGYLVDGGFASAVAAVLDAHHLMYTRIDGQPTVAVDVIRATRVTHQPTFEGRTRVDLAGAWTRETRTLDRGAIFVSIRQPAVRLILALFDPASPDALVRWGAFNAVFEQKEYMEPYVAEEVAREMLRDPATRQAWEAAIAADAALAKDSHARLEWFHRRHPSWDERKDLVPVYRTDRSFEVWEE
jgi:hypothetical protein